MKKPAGEKRNVPHQGIQYDSNPPLQAKRHLKKVLRYNAFGKEQVPSRSIPSHANAARCSVGFQKF